MTVSRRDFLSGVTWVGAGAVFGGFRLGLSAAAAQTTPLRRSIGELSLDDPIISTYRDFVRIMKEKSGDFLNWDTVAEVHFDYCPHGNWYFLPWHRAYLAMYEQLCRDLTGNAEFALPYWDWTADRQIPRAFSDPIWQESSNPLFEPTRTISPNASLPDDMVGPEVIDFILAETEFELFGSTRPSEQDSLDESWIGNGTGVQGEMEANPHNRIHCAIGGRMCQLISPRDPIFLLHHANIDRLWAVWNSLGNSNSDDPLWTEMTFTDNFIDSTANRYSAQVRDVFDPESLGYTYGVETKTIALSAPARRERFNQLISGAELAPVAGRAPKRVSVPVNGAAEPLNPLDIVVGISADVVVAASELPQTGGTGAVRELDISATRLEKPSIIAFIRQIDAERHVDTEVRIFLNCDYLSQDVPTSDPHFVTTIGFFGGDHKGHGGPTKIAPSVAVDLTRTIERLARNKDLDTDKLVVQLLPTTRPGVPLDQAGWVRAAEVEVVVF
ncbi:tyrosinase family protein [Mesorhizobium sp.]|uniref:tyrosinase family protein n=1 Tax=Mesorhizobium sp. TaxID=1871066 RepID=UPI000FE86030|nr:tyrosinase family protein [Mesorhizobium sp.]RWO21742.1 MAG: hypothetical protein EOS09_22280 [Mesorhizobium sp.]